MDPKNFNAKGNYYTIKPAELLTINKTPVSATDEDSPVLIEARLSETITSIHQLISTNGQLDTFLQNENDYELLQALKENDALIVRKIEDCKLMIRKLHESGVKVTLEPPVYDGSTVLKKIEKNETLHDDGGVYL